MTNNNKMTIDEIKEILEFDECYRHYRIKFFKFNDVINNNFC